MSRPIRRRPKARDRTRSNRSRRVGSRASSVCNTSARTRSTMGCVAARAAMPELCDRPDHRQDQEQERNGITARDSSRGTIWLAQDCNFSNERRNSGRADRTRGSQPRCPWTAGCGVVTAGAADCGRHGRQREPSRSACPRERRDTGNSPLVRELQRHLVSGDAHVHVALAQPRVTPRRVRSQPSTFGSAEAATRMARQERVEQERHDASHVARGVQEDTDRPQRDGSVRENHFCNNGALADATKKGPPIATVASDNSHGIGDRSTGGTRPAGMATGRLNPTSSSRNI